MHSGSLRGSLVLTAVAGLALAGCASPETRFVASEAHDVVVQVPWDWTPIKREDVLATLPQKPTAEQTQVPEGTWIAYYDGADRPSPEHVLADSADAPIVQLRSSLVPEEQRAAVTTDALRNAFRPITEDARAQQQLTLRAQGLQPPPFQLIDDEQFSSKDATGVHVVYRTGDEVYDQTTVTDSAHERWQAVVVYCSAACYARFRTQIEAVADSFTTKKP